MAELASLRERLDAYLEIVENDPSLDADERRELFSLAVWPERTLVDDVDYRHLMECRDKFCRYCAGTGTAAA